MALQIEITHVNVSGTVLDGFALALHGEPLGHSVYQFDEVSNALAFSQSLVAINADFSVKHAEESCCWAGEGCCK